MTGAGYRTHSSAKWRRSSETSRGNIGGSSRFSSTWGGGLKFQSSEKVGFRLEGRWTPTFIKADAIGWWCDPFWGCYVVSNAQYSNQLDLAGGVSVRF